MSVDKDMEPVEGPTSDGVDVQLLCQSLDKCTSDQKGLLMDSYLVAYKQLQRFFHLLGSVFSFVANDVDSKLALLENYRRDPEKGEHYETFESMIAYEEANKLLDDPKKPSGSRTALRLHRALEFFSQFMLELSQLEDKSGSGAVAKECYKKTLFKFHSWIIQKTATMAMYTLPTREQLVQRVFALQPEKEDPRLASETMVKLAQCSELVYSKVQKLYEERSLLELP